MRTPCTLPLDPPLSVIKKQPKVWLSFNNVMDLEK